LNKFGITALDNYLSLKNKKEWSKWNFLIN
jgi:hypothetical protein